MGYKDSSSNLRCSRVLSLLSLTPIGQTAHSTWSPQISHSCFCHGPSWLGCWRCVLSRMALNAHCIWEHCASPPPPCFPRSPHHNSTGLCAVPGGARGRQSSSSRRSPPCAGTAAAAPSLPASLRGGALPPAHLKKAAAGVPGGAPTHDFGRSQAVPGCGEPRRYRGRSRCQGNGGGAAEGRCGAERCGAERPRGRSGPGQVCAIRTALRRSGVCGGKGGGWGGTAVLPHSGAEKCRFLLHLQFCLAGWLGFLLVVLSEAVLLSVPQEEPEMEPRPPAWPLLCLLLLCQSSCAGEPRALSFCCVFSLSPLLPSFLPLLSPLPTPHRPRCGAAALCYDLSRR